MNHRFKTRLWVLIITLTLAVIICLTSCSPQSRINSICKKHPDLCKNKTVTGFIYDTIVYIDTVKGEINQGVIDSLGSDSTSIVSDTERATLSIWKENGKIRWKTIVKPYYINRHWVKKIPFKVDCNCPVPSKGYTWQEWLVFIVIALGCVFLGRGLRK